MKTASNNCAWAISSLIFFNTHKDTLYARLSAHPIYPGLFKTAYGVENVYTLEYETIKKTITSSIAQYLRTLISSQSKFDLFLQHKTNFTNSERIGLSIYMSEKGDCFHCHGFPLMTDNMFHNNGLDSAFAGQNKGLYLVTGNSGDLGKFSTPTLRNIEFTAPYMHDGRFGTLEEVVEFYDSGVKHSETLDPIMTKPGKERGLNLNVYEKKMLGRVSKNFQ
ncbi:cytochrome c peroxidase [Oscillatoria amoena NRMC-F 0135]|nr:cytochrome c peroxidase [Oscillatoria amoena NRMC-F 0135]